ncbi:MAG: hypothetical protein H0X53_02940, partial [Sphingomonas sp.]|nr:hypothetical protein [Sphingomonas sp.]
VRTIREPLAKPVGTVCADTPIVVVATLGALLPDLTAVVATALLDECATLVVLPALDALRPLLAAVRPFSPPLLAVIRALGPLLAVTRPLSALFPAIGALLCTLPTLAPLRARIAASLAILALRRAVLAIAFVAGL